MAKTKTIRLDMNNSVYNVVISDATYNIEIVLPKYYPNVFSYVKEKAKQEGIAFIPVDQLKIDLYFTILTGDAIPEIKLVKESEDMVIYGDKITLQADKTNFVSFISPDGGSTWSIINNNYDRNTDDEVKAELEGAINDVQSKLTEEKNRAMDVEKDLDNRLTNETSIRKNADSNLTKLYENQEKEITAIKEAGYQTEADVKAYLEAKHYVIDESYVHTDNNYTDADKTKVDTINLTTEG